jgi:hypothetical protein
MGARLSEGVETRRPLFIVRKGLSLDRRAAALAAGYQPESSNETPLDGLRLRGGGLGCLTGFGAGGGVGAATVCVGAESTVWVGSGAWLRAIAGVDVAGTAAGGRCVRGFRRCSAEWFRAARRRTGTVFFARGSLAGAVAGGAVRRAAGAPEERAP